MVERMKKIYYNMEITNSTSNNINCEYDVGLLQPIIENPKKYNINVNRCRIPLNGIPLTRKNIPFEQWSCGIQYIDSNGGSHIDIEYVPQVNPATIVRPNNYFVVYQDKIPNGQVSTVNAGITTTNTLDLSTIVTNQSFPSNPNGWGFSGMTWAYDFYGTFGTLFQVTTYDTVTAYYPNNITTPIYTFQYPSTGHEIIGITANPNTYDVWILYSINLNQLYMDRYTRTNQTSWLLANTWTLPANTNISMFCSCNQFIYAIINGAVMVYDVHGNNLVQTLPFTDANYIYSNGSNNVFVGHRFSNIGVYSANPTTGILTLTSNSINTSSFVDNYSIIGIDYNNNLLLWNGQQQTIQSYSISSGTLVNSYIVSLYGSYPIFVFPSVNGTFPVDSGNVDIYDYQTFLNQINSALSTAHNNLKSIAGYTPTQAPYVYFNPTDKLFNVVVQGVYLNQTTNNQPAYTLLINQTLWNMFLFPSTLFTTVTRYNDTFKAVIIQNNLYNAVYNGGTTPQYITVSQEAPTIQKFYDLVRILLVTNKIPVNGDIEGTNNAINLITDLAPDTTIVTPDDIIIYQPSVLRNYNLDSNIPLKHLDVHLFYGTKDGSIYPIQLKPNEYASVKLEFAQVID